MLKASGVQKIYRHPVSPVHVLKGIDLEVEDGDVCAVIGPSGAGKSTLLHVLGGLDKPDEGKVLFDGQELYRISERQRAKIRNQKIGFIFQFYHLLPEFTAWENVVLPALVGANMKSLDLFKAKAFGLLERVGLKDRAGHKPHELSGGEQQRVAIARALINQPKVIFCDEPTGNLDSESGRSVINLLMELNERNRQTLIIVTHDETIARRSGKVVYMRDGLLQSRQPSGRLGTTEAVSPI